MYSYDPHDHYWLVTENGLIFSSLTGGYVTESDSEYQAFTTRPDKLVTLIDSVASLKDVLILAGGNYNGLLTLAEAKAKAREMVKNCRQNSLDFLARSAGVSAIYDENRKASEMILAGQGESVLFGVITANQFGTDAGTKLGMNATNWAAFIKGENDRERLRGKRIEEGYLHSYYGVIPNGDLATVQNATASYLTHCQELLSAPDIAAILAVQEP